MPKRSNEFQALIHRIYEQLAPTGATVTESVFLKERGSDIQREIDVLIEAAVADAVIRLAVECRGRGRVSDIEWIDGLIGKYRDLPVDRVIAVSKLGFTPNAYAPALHRPELLVVTDESGTPDPYRSAFARMKEERNTA